MGIVRRRTGAFVAAGLAALLAVGTPVAAAADPIVPSLSGTVSLDTNANGVLDGSGAPGHDEGGLAGVGIELVCEASGAVLQSTTSGADGTWAFEDFDLGPDALNCPDGVVRVRATVADDRYSITDASGANDTPRTADEQVGLSAAINLTAASTEVVDTLVRPDWYLDLTVPIDGGTGSPAVFTGSAPFDSGCPADGRDCAIDDQTVRSGDTVTFTWAVTASSQQDLSPGLSAVVLEQTLDLHDGAIANFSRIPARCKPTGGGGADPASVIVDQDGNVIPEGEMPPTGTTSVTLRCNLGEWSQTGDAVTLQPVVKVSPTSPNGSTFTTTANVYAVDPSGSPTAVPAEPEQFGPIDITSVPQYELDKKGFFNLDAGTRDIGEGPELGYYTYAVVQVKTNRAVGVEAMELPATFTEDIFGFLPDGTTAYPEMKFALTQCIPNPNVWAGTVGGRPAPYGDYGTNRLDQTVVDSGTCSFTRNDPADLTSDYTVTMDDIDLTGTRYPTETANGSSLAAGPFYVASYRLQFFIPKSTIDMVDGAMDDRGSFLLYNRVGGFDPDGVSGSSNFGDDVEPGYCDPASVDGQNLNAPGMPHCDPMDDGRRSDNVVGPTSVVFAPGYFSKYILNTKTMYQPDWSSAPRVTGLTNPHAGDGTGEPGQVYESYVDWVNRSLTPWTGSKMCDVFDSTMAQLVPSSAGVSGGSDSIYAWLAPDNAPRNAAYNAKWIFEYAHIDTTGDDPISGGSVDPVTDRISGTWTTQRAANCDDGAATGGWFTDPNAVPGGIDAVNAVRVRPGIDPATGQATVQDASINNRLIFSFRIRGHFVGGPHDGDPIPSGSVIANFARVTNDQERNGVWSGRSYQPSPENTATDGDRITVTSAALQLNKRTITVDGVGDGAADFGITGSAVASNPIVWEIVSTLTSIADEPAPVSALTITDVLPEYAAYDPDCTASITGGTPADEVLYDTPAAGQTTLTWNLGTWTPNTEVPNRRICTLSDPLAPNGTSLVNYAEIEFAGYPNPPHDRHTVVLEQTGEVKLRKAVDAPLDVLNDDQVYTLSMQNFSETLTVAAPTMIEVFPYNGDSTPPGGANRSPASSFTGDLMLTAPATVTNIGGGSYTGEFLYTTDAPATINQNLTLNTSTWRTEAELGGDFSEVTGIKFIGAGNLTPFTTEDTSGVTVTFTLQAGDTANPFSARANGAGNVYSDRFTAFSSTFQSNNGTYQMLASNRVTVRTVSHSNGDLVFEDRDGDGLYTAGRDLLAPDGTVVNLYFEGRDGDEQVGSTTTRAGVYLFTKLPAGTYHVEIPAGQFGPGGNLEGYALASAPAAGETDVEQNDDVSHDAIDGAAGAIISNSFTLSATVDPRTKAVAGDEPVGENIHGIVDLTTTDPFSNLAIDLALERTPGIDIEKEVCTIADNSCDPAAALGEGGWSTDGVDGVGPVSETTARPYGSAVMWRIIVTNTGDQFLTDVQVTDPITPDCAATSVEIAEFADFAPGAVASYTCKTESITANITPNTATVVGSTYGSGGTVSDIDTANATTAGSLVINKVITGPGLDAFGDGPFTFHVVCGTAVDVEVTLTPTEGATTVTSDPINGIPLGTECTITETDDGGADATPAPVTVQIVSNDQRNTVIAELTNRFSQGTVALTKVLEGTAAGDEFVEGLEFDVLVTCQVETTDAAGARIIATLYSGTTTLQGGEIVGIVDENGDLVLLPVGTRCFGEETDAEGASAASVDFDSYDNAAVVGASDEEQLLSLTATNRFDLAEVVVTKIVEGDGAAGPYSFMIECVTDDGEAYPLPDEDAAFLLSSGESRTIAVLAGVTCTVSETNAPIDALVSIEDSDWASSGGVSDGIVVATADAAQTVVITNSFGALAATGGVGPWMAILVGVIALLVGISLMAWRRARGETRG